MKNEDDKRFLNITVIIKNEHGGDTRMLKLRSNV